MGNHGFEPGNDKLLGIVKEAFSLGPQQDLGSTAGLEHSPPICVRREEISKLMSSLGFGAKVADGIIEEIESAGLIPIVLGRSRSRA